MNQSDIRLHHIIVLKLLWIENRNIIDNFSLYNGMKKIDSDPVKCESMQNQIRII